MATPADSLRLRALNRAGDFAIACLIPTHYEVGMIGHIQVEPALQEKTP